MKGTQPPAVVPVKRVRCPGCGGTSLYASGNPYRPFCSERCKNLDLGAWASEHFRVASQDEPADVDLIDQPGMPPPAVSH